MPKSNDTKKHGTRYPWEKWFSRWRFMLIENKHYQIQTYSMSQLVHREAKKRNLRVVLNTKTKDGVDRIYVTQLIGSQGRARK